MRSVETEAEWQDGCHVWVGNGTEVKKRNNNWRNTGFSQTEDDPVVCVSWNDAHEYIKWLNEKEDRDYRFPTEAEWEYAARSRGKEYRYSWGNGFPSGNIADGSAQEVLTGVETWSQGMYTNGYRTGRQTVTTKKVRNTTRKALKRGNTKFSAGVPGTLNQRPQEQRVATGTWQVPGRSAWVSGLLTLPVQQVFNKLFSSVLPPQLRFPLDK
jgi:formylglycine-generating enzyme required for sulfatase activity